MKGIGIEMLIIHLFSLFLPARPLTRMTLTTPTIVARPQKRKMTVATCLSANGKPQSVIKWDTRLKGEATFQETQNSNGTVTVRSNYVVVPSRETHKQKLTCIVTYRNERITDSVVLNVQCELAPLFSCQSFNFLGHVVPLRLEYLFI